MCVGMCAVLNPSGPHCDCCMLEPDSAQAGRLEGCQGKGSKVAWTWFSDQ